jgi:hypothetical protein
MPVQRELARSPYVYLLDDADFRRWFQNVRRGSVVTAHEWLRRIGYIHKRFSKSPKEIASLSSKDATNFILDVVTALEAEKRSGSYISNCVKPIKSWLEFNGVSIVQRIKIPGRSELVKVDDEVPPSPEELGKILNAADLRAKAACALIAFSGMRLQVLGNYLGNDGLQIQDLPELTIQKGTVEFKQVPTVVVVRKALSKVKSAQGGSKQYFTFLPDEGCEYLKQYLEWRLRNGEELEPESPVITPDKRYLAGKHIRTTNIGDMLRKPIRDAGFKWRPYVLRRYFDTRLMMAESDRIIIKDWRVYWMGHKGDIEATYTVRKGLPLDVIEKMRNAYAEAAEKYLVTKKRESMTKEGVIATFNRQYLRLAGFTDDEIDNMGDLSQLTSEEMQEFIKRKSMQTLGLNGASKQKIVSMNEVRNYILEGWEFVVALPESKEAVVRLPVSS